VCLLPGCSHNGATPAAAQKAPATVDNRVKESDLTRVKLTPEAEQRLGIELAAAVESEVSTVSAVAGEVMLIPGKALIANAPVTGTIHFARTNLGVGQNVRKGEPVFRLTPVVSPQRDLRVTFEADVQSTKARLDTAAQQLERRVNCWGTWPEARGMSRPPNRSSAKPRRPTTLRLSAVTV
jgi:hypothetical protein